MKKQSSSPRRRRGRLPEVSQITGLIDDARKLRLTLAGLTNSPLLAEPARDAMNSLQNVAAKLELIAELVASAKTRSRKRRTQPPETSPPEPSLRLEGDN